jgi:hypothetical protein
MPRLQPGCSWAARDAMWLPFSLTQMYIHTCLLHARRALLSGWWQHYNARA